MGRLTLTILYVFMILIAISLAILMIVGFGVDYRVAGLVSCVIFLGLLYWGTRVERAKADEKLSVKLNDLENIINMMMENHQSITDQLADLSRVNTLDSDGPLKRLVGDVRSVEAVMNEVTRTVGGLETETQLIQERLLGLEQTVSRFGKEAEQKRRYQEKSAPSLSETMPAQMEAAEKPSLSDAQMKLIETCIHNEMFDIHLQPIVTLPQRKVVFYEALTRLTPSEEESLMPSVFLPVTRKANLMAKLDEMVFYRVVHILRRLAVRNKEVGLFCNTSIDLLRDEERYRSVMNFIDTNHNLVPSIVFEFSQATLNSFEPDDYECLDLMRRSGMRFSLDNIVELKGLDFSALSDLGFRYVKVPVGAMLGSVNLGKSDIHYSDLASLLNRSGIQLIVEKVERESDLVEVLELNANLAQGYLFSRPRPVKREMMDYKNENYLERSLSAASGQ